MRITKRGPLRLSSRLLGMPKTLKLMSLIVFVYSLGWGIVEPFLPIYLKSLLATYTYVGVVIGMLSIFSIFWTLFFGCIIDKVSKKKIIALTFFLYLPFSSILLSLKSFASFIFFRVYHSLIASSFWTTSEAYIREHSPKHRASEAFGLFDMSYFLSLVVGPVIGGLLILRYGFSILYSISLFAAIALFMLLFLKGSRRKARLRDILVPDFKHEFKCFIEKKGLMVFSIVDFFIGFCTGVALMLLPLFAYNLGANYLQVGIVYSLFYLPFISEFYFSIKADCNGRKPLIITGLALGAAFFLFLFIVKDIVMLFACSFLLSIAFAIIQPALQGRITELMPKSEIGGLTGVTRSIWLLGMGAGPIVAGFVSDILGLRWAFAICSFTLLMLLIFCLKLKFEAD